MAELQPLLDELVARWRADSASVHVLEEGVLRLRAHVGLPSHVAKLVETVPIGKGMAGLCAERNAPVNACNLQTDSTGNVKPGARATGIAGAIVVPIRDAAGALRGTLGIGVRREYQYSPEETERLEIEARAFA